MLSLFTLRSLKSDSYWFNLHESCSVPGTQKLQAYDLFGGALCARRSWQMIESAALELWGVQTQVSFTFNVTQCHFIDFDA